MPITVYTAEPEILLNKIKKAINEGDIRSWEYDKDGDFTHKSEQWAKRAWLSPVCSKNSLSLKIKGRNGIQMTKAEYAFYHGTFVEMLLSHFDERFSSAEISAK